MANLIHGAEDRRVSRSSQETFTPLLAYICGCSAPSIVITTAARAVQTCERSGACQRCPCR